MARVIAYFVITHNPPHIAYFFAYNGIFKIAYAKIMPNFSLSHMKEKSPLTHGLNYRTLAYSP